MIRALRCFMTLLWIGMNTYFASRHSSRHSLVYGLQILPLLPRPVTLRVHMSSIDWRVMFVLYSTEWSSRSGISTTCYIASSDAAIHCNSQMISSVLMPLRGAHRQYCSLMRSSVLQRRLHRSTSMRCVCDANVTLVRSHCDAIMLSRRASSGIVAVRCDTPTIAFVLRSKCSGHNWYNSDSSTSSSSLTSAVAMLGLSHNSRMLMSNSYSLCARSMSGKPIVCVTHRPCMVFGRPFATLDSLNSLRVTYCRRCPKRSLLMLSCSVHLLVG